MNIYPRLSSCAITSQQLLHPSLLGLGEISSESFTNGLILELRRFFKVQSRCVKLEELVIAHWIRKIAPKDSVLKDFSDGLLLQAVDDIFKQRDEYRRKKQTQNITEFESLPFFTFCGVCSDTRKNENIATYQKQVQKQSIKAKRRFTAKSERENQGRYQKKNVDKRDKRASANLSELRKTKNKLKHVKNELKAFQEQMIQDSKNNQETQKLREQLHVEKAKKVAAQKSASYMKCKVKNKKRCYEGDQKLEQLELECRQKDAEILYLESAVDTDINRKPVLRKDTAYSDELRICVMQLAALEVGTEKIAQVIKIVSECLFEIEFEEKELPSSSTVQNIIDEGHVLSKKYIAAKLDECTNWGIHKDGTARKKKKILDTTVISDSGWFFLLLLHSFPCIWLEVYFSWFVGLFVGLFEQLYERF